MKTSVTELPFNSFLGIQTGGDSAHVLRLPSGRQYLNHLGTVHASAQLALAEASSGEFLLKYFGSTQGIVPVVRRMEAKFRKPANGSIISTASATPESLAQPFRFPWSFTMSQAHIRSLQYSSGLFSVTKASNHLMKPTPPIK